MIVERSGSLIEPEIMSPVRLPFIKLSYSELKSGKASDI